MKVSVNVIAEVRYNCILDEEDSLKVAEYMEDEDVSVEEAIEDLYHEGVIALYEDCAEFDFSTQEFYNGEIEYEDE